MRDGTCSAGGRAGGISLHRVWLIFFIYYIYICISKCVPLYPVWLTTGYLPAGMGTRHFAYQTTLIIMFMTLLYPLLQTVTIPLNHTFNTSPHTFSLHCFLAQRRTSCCV